MAQSVYSPDPDPKTLQATKAVRIDKVDGSSIVGFCVDEQGKTTRVRTLAKFPGDPQVDAIIRETVATWRFKPFIVDGRPVVVCTERRYNLKFR